MPNQRSGSAMVARYVEGVNRLFDVDSTMMLHQCRAALISHLGLDYSALFSDFATDIQVKANFCSLKEMRQISAGLSLNGIMFYST